MAAEITRTLIEIPFRGRKNSKYFEERSVFRKQKYRTGKATEYLNLLSVEKILIQ